MQISHKTLAFQTKDEFDFIDFTDEVEKFVRTTEIKNGFVNIQTMHTTALLFLNENEPLLLEDFKQHLSQISPKGANYNHDDFTKRTVNMCAGECQNGHSHCKALHFPSNLVLNVIDGKMQLGQWQRIFLAELDKSRPRKVQIQVMGELTTF
ncbi:MAG: secondary thiamine-phosphate synthase enzyme YjbQ [Candidatus Nealsonbacteria bacterium]